MVKLQVRGSGQRFAFANHPLMNCKFPDLYLLLNFFRRVSNFRAAVRIFRGVFEFLRTTNGGQVEQTLRELRRLGRLEKIDAAAVQMLRSMARALDEDPGDCARWRQY